MIEFGDIKERAIAFPVDPGDYGQVEGVPGGVIYSSDKYLHLYDFGAREERPLVIRGKPFLFQGNPHEDPGIGLFQVRVVRLPGKEDRYQTWVLFRSGNDLRVLDVNDGLRDNGFGGRQEPGSRTGWLDLRRIKVSVQPALEWRQMYYEAWRLQRDYFWRKDMNGVDWEAIRERYAPLIDRVASRAEVADVIWEMYGELRASHAFEDFSGRGDYREHPTYDQEFLGVDWKYDDTSTCYRIAHIVKGDRWNAGVTESTTVPLSSASSPLLQPGIDVQERDIVLAIDGQRLTKDRGPQQLLVNKAGQEVELLIKSAKDGHERPVAVRALTDREERNARYRDWVDRNRCLVHKVTEEHKGHSVGYIHLPDMIRDGSGFAEFYRAYNAEYDREGLIIDVRWNTGGRISAEILARLGRKRVGYEYRQTGAPTPYPDLSPRGPMVTIMNEMTASDGEIFSHLFKELDLGPLIGTRTWGGTIGIRPRASLADNTVPSQPGAGLCFTNDGCIIENCGVEPDEGLEVDCAPQDYVRCADAQLVCALAEVMRRIREHPSVGPVAEPWLPHDDREGQRRAG